MVLQTNPDILAGASQSLSSYVGHTFEVRELPAKKSGVCAGEGEVCRVDHFTVSANHDQSESLDVLFLRACVCVWTKRKQKCQLVSNIVHLEFDKHTNTIL